METVTCPGCGQQVQGLEGHGDVPGFPGVPCFARVVPTPLIVERWLWRR